MVHLLQGVKEERRQMSVEPERNWGLEGDEETKKIFKTVDSRPKFIKPEKKKELKIQDDSEESNLIEELPQEIPIPTDPEEINQLIGLPTKQRPRN